jgi:hypothetical protein
MTTNAIVEHFGTPAIISPWLGGADRWMYGLTPFAADDDMTGMYVVTVNINITNGHLARWDCGYSPSPGLPRVGPEETIRGPQATASEAQGSPLLKFFIVSSNQIPGGRFIDTEQFPKLGFIANAPDLAIKTLKKVTLQEQRERLIANNPNQKTWAIKFFLTEADAPRLESFTSNNIDNNVLMTFGDEPLLSASISEPISGGILGVTLTNQVIVEEARRRLATQ